MTDTTCRLLPKLAFRNLFQDRLRFDATVVGIGFSMVLVGPFRWGLYVSFEDNGEVHD